MIGGPLLVLLALIGVVAIVVWTVQWANDHRRTAPRSTFLTSGSLAAKSTEPEYEEKRKLIGSR
jgi:hypothetical protein